MARKPIPPKYRRLRRSKGSDSAFVEINTHRVYLGPYGSEESRERYGRVIAEWRVSGRYDSTGASHATVAELSAAYWTRSQLYYGPTASESYRIKIALRPLVRLYGRTRVAEFGPMRLKAVRQQFVEAGNCRYTVNDQTGRLKRVFKWGVEQELVPAEILHGLQAVAGLRRGRCEAPESEPVRPVPEAHVYAVCKHLPPEVAALLRLQLLTAGRPGELVIMRPIDLDTGGRVWLYRPRQHKGTHLNRTRTLYLGPRSQDVVRPFLAGCAVDGYLFAPKSAEAWRHAKCRTHRRSDQRSNSKATTRVVGDHYTRDSYRRCVQRACKDTGIPVFSMHAIRHTAGTIIRREHGLEAAQLLLGHARADVTQLYAEVNHAKAVEVARKIG